MTPKQEKMLEEMHSEIVGNPKYKRKGLIDRVQKLERQATLTRWFQYAWSALLAFFGFKHL